ncbi:transposase (plasmid) [Citricoccus nitrophenolicus]
MKKVIRVKLLPDAAASGALLATLQACNAAATQAAKIARTRKIYAKRPLQRLVYQDLKGMGLSAQPALLVISKVSGAYATLKSNLANGRYGKKGTLRREKIESTPVTFRPDAAQPYDDRCLSWNHQDKTVSIWTVNGRLQGIPFTGHPDQLAVLAAHRKGESDLMAESGNLYLMATIDVPEPEPADPDGFIGVDMGIVNIATTSTGTNWSGGAVTATRKRNQRLRKKLQAKGTKSAKRLLKKRSRKESRFVADTNHQIAKSIVTEAERTGRGIAVEHLTGIRERARLRKPQRVALHSWAFAQLGAFLAYKALAAGVGFTQVDPAYTSQECSTCHHIAKANRKTRDLFECKSCGVSLDADYNAALNIARRGEQDWWGSVNVPNAA